MRKMLAILILLTALLASCKPVSKQEELQQFSDENFYEIEYKGHSYIMFMHDFGHQGFAGLTHNPDCPCKKGGEE